MEVVGFIGASGTGKSHHALVVAYDHEIQTIIDDGLLIDHNRIVAGRSAKDETNRLKAVRRAVFNNPDDAAAMKAALAKAALDSIRSFFYDNNGKKLSPFERSVVRPVFSYYGKLTFSNDVLESLVRHALSQSEGVTKINRLKVAINYNSTRNGLAIILSLTIAYGQNIKKLMSRIRRDIQHEVEYTTGMAVEILKITVRDISPQPSELQEES